MKPLTSVKVKRGEILKEWQSAIDQLTDAGRDDFARRQRERIKQAQADRAEQGDKVRSLKARP